MFGKIFFFLFAVLAGIAMASSSCVNIHKDEHCAIFKDFCNDKTYSEIRSKCAKTCGDC